MSPRRTREDPAVALAAGARRILGRALTGSEAGLFDKYLKLIAKWQKAQRLVGSVEPLWVVENLFLDSLLFLRVIPPGVRNLLDVGSGAGLPGIPIKIVRPELALVLLESRRRRASFLRAAVRELGLEDARVVHARLETAGAELAGPFDALVMRCAGPAEEMLDRALPLLAPGGVAVVSGPPGPGGGGPGSWVEVPGIWKGQRRRFRVVEKPRG